MVDQINGVGPLGQKFSKQGMKLSELKDNKLLFDYFKKNGYDDSSVIYSTDIEKLKAKYDKNENGLSVKEARAMGLEGSRREIKAAIKSLDAIAANELKDDELYPVNVSDKEIHLYRNDETKAIAVRQNDDGTLSKEYYDDAGRLQVADKYALNQEGDDYALIATEEFDKDGNVISGSYLEDGVGVDVTAHYYNGKKTDETTVKGQNKLFTQYDSSGKNPVKVVESFKGDPDSFKTTEFDYENGQLAGKTFTYEGKMIKDGVVKETVQYKDGKEAVLTQFKSDGTEIETDYEKGIQTTRLPKGDVEPENTVKHDSANPVTPKKGTKTTLPDGWKRSKVKDNSPLRQAKNVEEVSDHIINKLKADADSIDKEKLMDDLKKYNPSVFDKNGNVKKNVDWSKLDTPTNADSYKSAKPEEPKNSKVGELPKDLHRPEERTPGAPRFDWSKEGVNESEEPIEPKPGELSRDLHRPEERTPGAPKAEWTKEKEELQPKEQKDYNGEAVDLTRPEERKSGAPRHDWSKEEKSVLPEYDWSAERAAAEKARKEKAAAKKAESKQAPIPEPKVGGDGVPDTLRRQDVQTPKAPRHDWSKEEKSVLPEYDWSAERAAAEKARKEKAAAKKAESKQAPNPEPKVGEDGVPDTLRRQDVQTPKAPRHDWSKEEKSVLPEHKWK